MAVTTVILEPNEQRELFTKYKAINLENLTDKNLSCEVFVYDLRVTIKIKEEKK